LLAAQPPNLRLLLGSEDGVFIHPAFGARFADDLNNSMSIVDAWCEAAGYADIQTAKSWRYRFTMGTRHMSYAYRDDSQGGSWRTISDSIWNWGAATSALTGMTSIIQLDRSIRSRKFRV
jgi:hypothetical protein